jgi:hypothetical protein
MGRRCRPARRLPKGVGLAGSTSAPSGRVGKGTGGKPKAFAFTWQHQTEWVETIVARLFCSEVEEVIKGLQHIKAPHPQAAELIGYLTNHQQRVDYGFARKAGYPIGSGGIGQQTSSSAMCASSIRVPGSMWRRLTKCWPCGVPSITAHSTESLKLTRRELNLVLERLSL